MCILIDEKTRVIVQGITGRVGSFQTKIMLDYGTKVVAGVTPGKGGQKIYGVPIYDLVEEAVEENEADVAIGFVPAPFAADSALEAIEAGLRLVVITAEGVPIIDTIKVLRRAKQRGALVLGPDTAGLISPGRCKVGVHPHKFCIRGNIGVVSRSGSLSYEVLKSLTEAGIGQSTVVDLGGGPMWGLTYVDILKMFEEDDQTEAIVLLGEIGGMMEEEAAKYIHEMSKPIVALIVGRKAPEGERMGHASALVQYGRGTAKEKIKALEDAGAYIVKAPREIPNILKEIL